MRYFVISDIHGFYDVMINALNSAGYDQHNHNHHLLVLGDMFDRGKQSLQVYEYLYPLHKQNKATIILGNHDSFLQEFLEGDTKKAIFNVRYNGFGTTLQSFSGIEPTVTNLDVIRDIMLERYPTLLDWLNSFPYFLEIDDYVFVHGGIDGGTLDWKTMLSKQDYIWSREINLPPIPGRTVVAGHHRVATIRIKTNNYHLLHLQHPEYFDILYEDGKILIDRSVEVTNELNVLVLDL